MKLIHVTTVPETLRFFTGQVGFLKQQGFAVEAVSSPGTLLDEFGAWVKMLRKITPLQDLVALIQLWRIFKKTKPDIVHGHTPKGGLLAMIAARSAGVPVCIFHIHGLPHLTATSPKAWILRISTFVACYLASTVFCVSRTVRAVTIEQGLCADDRIQVLVNGSSNGIDSRNQFNPERFSNEDRIAIRLRSGIPATSFVIGFVGRMVVDKGLCELVTSFAEIAKTRGDVHLLIAGHPEPHDPLPRRVRLVLRAHPQIHLAGWTNDIASIYACMDMLILPSYREGFPNVLLEAAAMKLPIVTTSVPGCLDAIQPGNTGLLVSPKNAKELTEAIRRYMDETGWSVTFSQNPSGRHSAANIRGFSKKPQEIQPPFEAE